MKIIKLSILALFFSLNAFCQLTYVPDDNFEKFIETMYPIANNGSVNDNYVLSSGLTTSGLNISNAFGQISDLTGLQDFNNLTILTIENLPIINIDLSNVPLHRSSMFTNATNLVISDCPFVQKIILPHLELCFMLGNLPYLNEIVFQSDNVLYGAQNNSISGCNSLTSFNISNISDVEFGSILYISSCNHLTCVNLKNGKCNKWGTVTLLGCPVLFCVEVDDPSFCVTAESINTWKWTMFYTNPSLCNYSTNCNCMAGVSDLNEAEFSISPNPATSKISVKSNTELIGSQFIIHDKLGKEVKSGIITSEDTEIDLSNLTQGMYLFKISADIKESFKIIKQ